MHLQLSDKFQGLAQETNSYMPSPSSFAQSAVKCMARIILEQEIQTQPSVSLCLKWSCVLWAMHGGEQESDVI